MMVIIEWRGIRTITNRNNQLVVMSRKAKLVILAEDGRELQSMIWSMVLLFMYRISSR